MTCTTATNCNHNPALGSILKRSPAPPAEKIRAAAMLLFGVTLEGFAQRLGRTRNHLSQVINGSRRDSARLRGDITGELGVDAGDIWPSSQGASSESSASLPQAPGPVCEIPLQEPTHA